MLRGLKIPKYLIDFEGTGQRNKPVWYIYNGKSKQTVERNLTLKEAREKVKRMNL